VDREVSEDPNEDSKVLACRSIEEDQVLQVSKAWSEGAEDDKKDDAVSEIASFEEETKLKVKGKSNKKGAHSYLRCGYQRRR